MLKAISIVIACVGFSVAALADSEPVPPNFDQAKFNDLAGYVATKGTAEDPGDGSVWMVVQTMVPNNPNVNHRLDYVDVVATTDTSGNFQPGQVIVGWETWTLGADSNWTVDQWSYQMEGDGEIDFMSHQQLIEEPGGEVTSLTGVPTPQATLLQNLATELNNWYQQVPATVPPPTVPAKN